MCVSDIKQKYLFCCRGPAISLQYTVSLVQWVNHLLPVQAVSGSHPGDAKTHNGTGFFLLALSRCVGDPDVIDHWGHPRLCADNGKLHSALCRQCEKPAVITHAFPPF